MNLEELRNQIDDYDQQIQTLLQKRTEVVEQVGELKKSQNLKVFIKPGREAKILRRLMQNHKGNMQARVVAQIWREIMMASLHVEQPFKVAVTDTINCRKLARDHFGCVVEQEIFSTPEQAIDSDCMFAVIPNWQQVTELLDGDTCQVVFQLPVVYREGETPEQAYVVGGITSEETGDDTVLESEGRVLGRYANPVVLERS